MPEYHGLARRVNGIRTHSGRQEYKLHAHLINSRDYGTPQSRNRWYFIGTKIEDMKHHKLEMVLPSMEAPPGLEEYLDPSVKGVDDHTWLPTGAHARQALAHAVAELMACGGNPYTYAICH